jgi:hypothetical protein
MNDERTIFVFHQGRVEDVKRLTEAIADKLILQLFNLDGRLFWLSEAGQLTPMTRKLLADLICRHFISVHLARRDDGSHFVEYLQLVPEGQDLIDIMDALVSRVAKGPSQPRVLSAQKRQEIRERIRVGEPRESVAQAYDISPADIKAVMAAA